MFGLGDSNKNKRRSFFNLGGLSSDVKKEEPKTTTRNTTPISTRSKNSVPTGRVASSTSSTKDASTRKHRPSKEQSSTRVASSSQKVKTSKSSYNETIKHHTSSNKSSSNESSKHHASSNKSYSRSRSKPSTTTSSQTEPHSKVSSDKVKRPTTSKTSSNPFIHNEGIMNSFVKAAEENSPITPTPSLPSFIANPAPSSIQNTKSRPDINQKTPNDNPFLKRNRERSASPSIPSIQQQIPLCQTQIPPIQPQITPKQSQVPSSQPQIPLNRPNKSVNNALVSELNEKLIGKNLNDMTRNNPFYKVEPDLKNVIQPKPSKIERLLPVDSLPATASQNTSNISLDSIPPQKLYNISTSETSIVDVDNKKEIQNDNALINTVFKTKRVISRRPPPPPVNLDANTNSNNNQTSKIDIPIPTRSPDRIKNKSKSPEVNIEEGIHSKTHKRGKSDADLLVDDIENFMMDSNLITKTSLEPIEDLQLNTTMESLNIDHSIDTGNSSISIAPLNYPNNKTNLQPLSLKPLKNTNSIANTSNNTIESSAFSVTPLNIMNNNSNPIESNTNFSFPASNIIQNNNINTFNNSIKTDTLLNMTDNSMIKDSSSINDNHDMYHSFNLASSNDALSSISSLQIKNSNVNNNSSQIDIPNDIIQKISMSSIPKLNMESTLEANPFKITDENTDITADSSNNEIGFTSFQSAISSMYIPIIPPGKHSINDRATIPCVEDDLSISDTSIDTTNPLADNTDNDNDSYFDRLNSKASSEHSQRKFRVVNESNSDSNSDFDSDEENINEIDTPVYSGSEVEHFQSNDISGVSQFTGSTFLNPTAQKSNTTFDSKLFDKEIIEGQRYSDYTKNITKSYIKNHSRDNSTVSAVSSKANSKISNETSNKIMSSNSSRNSVKSPSKSETSQNIAKKGLKTKPSTLFDTNVRLVSSYVEESRLHFPASNYLQTPPNLPITLKQKNQMMKTKNIRVKVRTSSKQIGIKHGGTKQKLLSFETGNEGKKALKLSGTNSNHTKEFRDLVTRKKRESTILEADDEDIDNYMKVIPGDELYNSDDMMAPLREKKNKAEKDVSRSGTITSYYTRKQKKLLGENINKEASGQNLPTNININDYAPSVYSANLEFNVYQNDLHLANPDS